MILGIDPGDTTGFAVLTPEGQLVLQGMISLEHLTEAITRLVEAFKPIVIVVERLPAHQPNPKQVQVVAQVQAAFGHRSIEWIGPGEWKTRNDLISPLQGSHARDAVRLTDCWLKKNGVPMT